MKVVRVVVSLFAAVVPPATAFSFQAPPGRLLNVNENCQRDVYSMADWATNCGVQKAEGCDITSFDGGNDYELLAQQNLPAGSPILFVPNEMIFASYKAAQEFGGYLATSENELANANFHEKIPLFRLFVKILVEYEKGEESPWFPWFNSMPRLFNTGASMTHACFDCLPPYAAWLALTERKTFIAFQKAVKYAGVVSEGTMRDVNVLKWAYNIATTRSIDWYGERLMAPMADMFNHGTETCVDITYDDQGNCMATTSRDVPAGSPLRVSLGNPTNPSVLFATYGFLDDTSPATFCKVMHLESEMRDLGYEFSDLLFYKDTGDISPQVYDVQLYSILKQNDLGTAQEFYRAVLNGDEATKSQFHQQYWQYTKGALQNHVDGFLNELEKLSYKAQSYDPRTHPRVPVILQHNYFVKETFQRVKQNLDFM